MLNFTPAPFENDYNVDNWPRWCADHCDVDKVKDQGNELVNTIIDNAPIVGHGNIVVDVRTQRLNLNHYTLAPGWHEDDTEDSKAIHHLYIIGKNRTEFLINDVPTEFPANNYVSYTNDIIHQAVEVHTPEFRLFVRVQECEKFISGWSKIDLMPYYCWIFPKSQSEGIQIAEEEYLRYFDV